MCTDSGEGNDARPAFLPRAHWVLDILAQAVGREAIFVDSGADLIYAPNAPAGPDQVWIPLERDSQAFFEGDRAFPGDAVRFGYDADGPQAARAAAVTRWRAWAAGPR